MLKGDIQLTLMMGPVVPVPVPKEVIEALQSVQVTSGAGEPSGFELSFALDKNSPLNTLLLMLGQVGPVIRTIIVVTINGIPHVIMDGVVTQHQVTPEPDKGVMTLRVNGKDLTAAMDFIDLTGVPYPAMPDEAQVGLILARYAMYGMIPLIIPRILMDVPIPTERIPSHQGTDLHHINMLAERAGYVFYIEPGPAPGANIAYWGPQIKVGVPHPALNIDMDAHNNIESLNFRFDGESGVLPIVFIQNPETRAPIPIPIPDISPLNPPLGLIPPAALRVEMMRDTAKLNPIQAASAGLARASASSDAITAEGSLDVICYGHILRSRGLVGVRGVGHALNGLYYVKSVTHNIRAGEYKQRFTLTRNGLVSTVPTVPV
jgi:hypothetical protein